MIKLIALSTILISGFTFANDQKCSDMMTVARDIFTQGYKLKMSGRVTKNGAPTSIQQVLLIKEDTGQWIVVQSDPNEDRACIITEGDMLELK